MRENVCELNDGWINHGNIMILFGLKMGNTSMFLFLMSSRELHAMSKNFVIIIGEWKADYGWWHQEFTNHKHLLFGIEAWSNSLSGSSRNFVEKKTDEIEALSSF